jgi:glycosyltransferase involved in cell wall biosynthesis
VTRGLWFIVESGTDVRLVEGLASRWPLTLLARRITGGREISQPTLVAYEHRTGPGSFAGFAAWAASRLVSKRSSIGLVLVQGYGIAALAANLAGRLARIPVVMLVCSPTEAYYRCRQRDGDRPFRQAEWFGIRVLAWLNARVGGQYVVLSPYLTSKVRGHGTRRPIAIVPVYGVDLRVFAPASEPRAAVRRRLGLPVDPALVFFSSRIAPEKDPDTLLAAVAALRRDGRDVRIVHRSGGHAEFSRRASEHGLRGAIIDGPALRPGAELAEYYQASDVCVQASREEGLGFSPLEALACGIPVVAAAVGGLRDTIVEGHTGWTYSPGDAQALARAIAHVLDDPAEARRRTGHGRALVAREYDRDMVFGRLEAIFEPLIPPRESGRSGLAAAL